MKRNLSIIAEALFLTVAAFFTAFSCLAFLVYVQLG